MDANERLEICKKCGILTIDPTGGPVCDNSRWINPDTGEVSNIPKIGGKRGCGCRLNGKVKNPSNHCIVRKG